jgi:hypothetical protein
MRSWNPGWLVVAAFAVAACSREPEPVDLGLPAASEPEITAETRTSALQDMLGTGIGGEVHVTPHADHVAFHLTVQDAAPETTLGVRLQAGTCESPGAELAVLEAVRTGVLGNGTAASTIEADAARLMDGAHVVALYAPGSVAPVACTPIPAHR